MMLTSSPNLRAISAWLARLALVYGLMGCVMLSLAMPSFQNPDEPNHFRRAEQIAAGHLLAERHSELLGGPVSPGIKATADLFDPLRFHPDRHVTPEMTAKAASIGWDGPKVLTHFPNSAIYPAPFYLPAAAGVLVGKALALSVATTLNLARMLTGICCVLLSAWGIRLAAQSPQPNAAIWLFTLTTLPMTMALQNAASQDGLLNAAMLVAVALILRLDGGARDAMRFWSAVLLLGLITMARPPYAPLFIVPLAMPFQSAVRRMMGAALIVVLCLGWTQIADPAHVITGQSAGADVLAQRQVILDPLWDVMLVLRTLRTHTVFYFDSFVGLLGWLDTSLPRSFYLLAGLMLALSLWLTAGRLRLGVVWRQAAIPLAMAGCVALVFLSIYLTFSTVRSPTIDGVQGRYFIPIVMLLACFASSGGLSERFRGIAGWAVMLFPALSLAVTLRSVLMRYYQI